MEENRKEFPTLKATDAGNEKEAGLYSVKKARYKFTVARQRRLPSPSAAGSSADAEPTEEIDVQGAEAVVWALIHGVFSDDSYLDTGSLRALMRVMACDPLGLSARCLHLSTIDRWNLKGVDELPPSMRSMF